MKTKTCCAPIIHGRTYTQDFPSQLLVRPEDFSNADIRKIRPFILDATSNLDLHQRPRWLVVDDGRRRIAGIACYVQDLAKRAGSASRKYFYDAANRRSHAFVGICVPSGTCVLPSDADLWELYEKHIANLWMCQTQTSRSAPYSEQEFVQAEFHQGLPPVHKVMGITLYEANIENDYALFQKCLAERGTCRFSSGMDFRRLVEKKHTVATTKPEDIKELEEYAKKQPPEQSSRSSQKSAAEYALSMLKNFLSLLKFLFSLLKPLFSPESSDRKRSLQAWENSNVRKYQQFYKQRSLQAWENSNVRKYQQFYKHCESQIRKIDTQLNKSYAQKKGKRSLSERYPGPSDYEKTLQKSYDNMDKYLRLYRDHEPQIRSIETQLRKNISKERTKFFDTDRPAMQSCLRGKQVDEDALSEWIDLLTQQMERSFRLSEDLLSKYQIRDLEQLHAEISKSNESIGVKR